MPERKKRVERLENFALFAIIYILIYGAFMLLHVQGITLPIIFNICLLLASRTMLRRDYETDIFRKSELPEERPKRQLLLGAAYGALLFLQIFLLLLLISAFFPFRVSILPWLSAEATIKHVVSYIVLNVLMQITASYAEEALWRQYFWRALEALGLPGAAVLLIITLIFALLHKPGTSWLSIALISLISLELGLLRMKYGERSFLLTGTAHFVYNLLNMFIG